MHALRRAGLVAFLLPTSCSTEPAPPDGAAAVDLGVDQGYDVPKPHCDFSSTAIHEQHCQCPITPEVLMNQVAAPEGGACPVPQLTCEARSPVTGALWRCTCAQATETDDSPDAGAPFAWQCETVPYSPRQ